MVLSVRMQFDGNALEAMLYYAEVFGVVPAERIMSDEEMMGSCYPSLGEERSRLLSGRLEIGGLTLVFSDRDEIADPGSRCHPHLELSFDDEPSLEERFAQLADEGRVLHPLGGSLWSRRSGTVIDRYGTTWTLSLA